jgi:hypothetical protein
MQLINGDTWHGRLFVWSYSARGEAAPKEFDLWRYLTTVAGALAFLACASVILVVLNAGTLPLGVFAEPIWEKDPRFRRLRFPGGIPIIAVAAPLGLALAAWRNWATYGLIETLAPFVVTALMGFALLGCCVLFNGVRRRLPKLKLGGTGRQAEK